MDCGTNIIVFFNDGIVFCGERFFKKIRHQFPTVYYVGVGGVILKQDLLNVRLKHKNSEILPEYKHNAMENLENHRLGLLFAIWQFQTIEIPLEIWDV